MLNIRGSLRTHSIWDDIEDKFGIQAKSHCVLEVEWEKCEATREPSQAYLFKNRDHRRPRVRCYLKDDQEVGYTDGANDNMLTRAIPLIDFCLNHRSFGLPL